MLVDDRVWYPYVSQGERTLKARLTVHLKTKYMKNRKYNQGLKNVASWAYWSGTGQYAMGTERQNQPFFEALTGTFPIYSLVDVSREWH